VAQPLEPVELEGLTLREFLIRALQDRAEGVLRQRMESGKPPDDDRAAERFGPEDEGEL
jgi:hypothetical protein